MSVKFATLDVDEVIQLVNFFFFFKQKTAYEITNCDIGLTMHDQATATNNYLHHNRCQAIGGGIGTNMLLENNELAFHNTNNNDGGTDCSGAKLIGSNTGIDGLTWRGNYVHHNN